MEEKKRLPDGELEIMQIVWKKEPPVSRAEIEEGLKDKHLAPTTILTFLSRLCSRGFLKQEKRGKLNYYTPLVSEREYLARESRSIIDRLYGGSIAAFAMSLCDGGVSREELEELRKMLEEGRL